MFLCLEEERKKPLYHSIWVLNDIKPTIALTTLYHINTLWSMEQLKCKYGVDSKSFRFSFKISGLRHTFNRWMPLKGGGQSLRWDVSVWVQEICVCVHLCSTLSCITCYCLLIWRNKDSTSSDNSSLMHMCTAKNDGTQS